MIMEELEMYYDAIDNLNIEAHYYEYLIDILNDISNSDDEVTISDNSVSTYWKKISAYPSFTDIKQLWAPNEGKSYHIAFIDNKTTFYREEHTEYVDFEKMYCRELYEKICENNRIIFQTSIIFWFGPEIWQDDTNVNVVKHYVINDKQVLISDFIIWARGKIEANYYISGYYPYISGYSSDRFICIGRNKTEITKTQFKKRSYEARKKVDEIFAKYKTIDNERREDKKDCI
jgi:hypothetical protein